jgi:hypothetical protein
VLYLTVLVFQVVVNRSIETIVALDEPTLDGIVRLTNDIIASVEALVGLGIFFGQACIAV